MSHQPTDSTKRETLVRTYVPDSINNKQYEEWCIANADMLKKVASDELWLDQNRFQLWASPNPMDADLMIGDYIFHIVKSLANVATSWMPRPFYAHFNDGVVRCTGIWHMENIETSAVHNAAVHCCLDKLLLNCVQSAHAKPKKFWLNTEHGLRRSELILQHNWRWFCGAANTEDGTFNRLGGDHPGDILRTLQGQGRVCNQLFWKAFTGRHEAIAHIPENVCPPSECGCCISHSPGLYFDHFRSRRMADSLDDLRNDIAFGGAYVNCIRAYSDETHEMISRLTELEEDVSREENDNEIMELRASLTDIGDTITMGWKSIKKLDHRLFLWNDLHSVNMVSPYHKRFVHSGSVRDSIGFFVTPKYIDTTWIVNSDWCNETSWHFLNSFVDGVTKDLAINTLKHFYNVRLIVDDICESGNLLYTPAMFNWIVLLPLPIFNGVFHEDRGKENTLFPCRDQRDQQINTLWVSFLDQYDGIREVVCDYCSEAAHAHNTRLFAKVVECMPVKLRDVARDCYAGITQNEWAEEVDSHECDIEYFNCDHLYCNSLDEEVGLIELSDCNHVRCCVGCMKKQFVFCSSLGDDARIYGMGLWHEVPRIAVKSAKSCC